MLKLVDLPVLHKFTLYRTRTNYYLIGRDEKKTFWRILKIDRTEPNELNLFEDPTRYTHDEITQLKKWISRGNQKYGGLRAETTCYGLIGFVKFLGPYYMLVIKRRKKVGEICGHTVYGVVESQMIMIPYPSRKTIDADSSAERKYKKLLNMVDLSKDFYFSYTYHLMYSLQKNICNTERGKIHDETMFVWNEYLTHGIRRILQNTVWTVSLVYGFFQQTKCLVSDEQFILTVIARRSRHYAGTRYLRRGVNEEGSVANEVETEQIVTKEVPEGQKIPITSVVQMRGSIPLFWSQKPSVFNPQPNIILNNKDRSYVATQLHFENLKQRYGKLIIILNLLKAGKHRENILREEFEKAILFINGGTRRENHLKANHFDLNKHYKSGADRAFELLCADGKEALESINLFFGEAPSGIGADGVINDIFFNALRGDWNIVKKNRDKIIALRRHLYNTFQDSEKQNAINVFLGKFKPQLGKPALWELRSDQQNTMRNSSNLNINNLRPNHSRSFSDNLILGSLDLKELVQENHQPSRAGLNSGWETTSNGGWETTSEVGFCEEEPSSSRVHSVIRDEDNLRRIGSRQMFLEVDSTSDSHGLEDAPGLSHSYNATFITAEEMFERCSSTSSDLIIEVFSFITISVLSIEVTCYYKLSVLANKDTDSGGGFPSLLGSFRSNFHL
ncbi:hypothetical protein BRARA_I04833 [Brassica rapa]|uniref:SAC domain-containing protein n=1 Tax=Brassica campestris TaxID=3711 RepID=A0A397Y425_BRACM|nr:hypothetical protein BRARA_I04833 [Brassica rapa]